MEPLHIILIAVGVVALLLIVWLIAIYNRFQALRQHVRESWHNIDSELKRRYDLIPNLVETVKGYAAHERDVLERVTQLRSRAQQNAGAHDSQAADETMLMLGVRDLFAVAEAYPDLKASDQFLALQKELAITEDRIAASRRFYNANVREMNQLCAMFPTSLVASLFNFEPETFFELSTDAERVVPRVSVAQAV